MLIHSPFLTSSCLKGSCSTKPGFSRWFELGGVSKSKQGQEESGSHHPLTLVLVCSDRESVIGPHQQQITFDFSLDMDQPSQAQHLSNTLLNPKDESDAKSSRPFTLRETRVWFAAGRVGTVCSTSPRVKGTTERSVDVVFLSLNIIWPLQFEVFSRRLAGGTGQHRL